VTAFDWPAFRAAISGVIEARGLSDREVATGAGVAPSTITRAIRKGDNASVENTARLADWAGLALDAFVQRHTPLASPTADDTRNAVAALRASEAAAAALRLMLTTSERPA
jgi:transcriptional regulator with XRE-family HTH domain